MATNANSILAGIGAGGVAGTSLAWFGPTSATAPVNGTSPLNTFYDAGYVATTGLTLGDAITSNPIQAYGALPPVRVLITGETTTFHLTFLESNTTALEVYNRKVIGSIVPSSGAFTVTANVNQGRQLYSAVFDVVDGTNHLRIYAPSVEVTDKDDLAIVAGQPISYGVTLTAYPDPTGLFTLKSFYVVASDIS